jgi:hypothetical protein
MKLAEKILNYKNYCDLDQKTTERQQFIDRWVRMNINRSFYINEQVGTILKAIFYNDLKSGYLEIWLYNMGKPINIQILNL